MNINLSNRKVRAENFFWPQSRGGDRPPLAPPRGSAAETNQIGRHWIHSHLTTADCTTDIWAWSPIQRSV